MRSPAILLHFQARRVFPEARWHVDVLYPLDVPQRILTIPDVGGLSWLFLPTRTPDSVESAEEWVTAALLSKLAVMSDVLLQEAVPVLAVRRQGARWWGAWFPTQAELIVKERMVREWQLNEMIGRR